APLNSDIATVARNVSRWIGRPETPAALAPATADAVAAALGPPTDVATLILPADASWGDGAEPARPHPERSATEIGDDTIKSIAATLGTGEPTVIFLGGQALRRAQLNAAARIAAGTGARLMGATFVPRTERGAGIPGVERLAYFAEQAAAQLEGVKHIVLVDATSPVSFFAYPGKASDLVPPGCEVHTLSAAGDDSATALAHLADLVGDDPAPGTAVHRPEIPPGALTNRAIAAAIAAVIPEGAIISDESATASAEVAAATAACPPHDYLQLMGGAIGQGLPVATGAAVASPGRPVFALEADGSSMYTIQSLWTQAREQLDVTTVIFNNRSYAILNIELGRTGAGEGGPKARELFDLSRPDLDFVRIAEGMGVPATAASTTDELTAALERAAAEPGPHLIDAQVTRG
ncbi:MAG: acetolactate synthase large subunit, partial [Desertimonas sp.]